MVRNDHRLTTQRLLADVFGRAVRISDAAKLGGDWAPVWRLSLDNGSSVVAKTRREESGPWGDEAAVLDNELRGLELVSGLGVDVTPRLRASDVDLGVVVMTDVGSGPSVQDMLFADGAAAASASLIALARTTGVLHSASRGIERSWQGRTTFLERTFEFWPELCEAASALNFPAPVGLSADIEALRTALADPRHRVFVHGDLGPHNAVLSNGRVRLVDFEGSGFRHFGLDAACLRLPFPAYGHWAVLSATVIAAMDQTYRSELSNGWPGALDDETYEVGVAAGCAAWAIIRAHRLPLIASSGQEPELAVRRRTQIVQTLTSFAEIALQAGHFEALARWFLALTDEMKERWDRHGSHHESFRPSLVR